MSRYFVADPKDQRITAARAAKGIGSAQGLTQAGFVVFTKVDGQAAGIARP